MTEKTGDNAQKLRQRAPRACLYCRTLKAKCELGPDDKDKCIRCKKEAKDCVFVASRRGGQNRRKRLDKIGKGSPHREFPKQAEQQISQFHENTHHFHHSQTKEVDIVQVNGNTDKKSTSPAIPKSQPTPPSERTAPTSTSPLSDHDNDDQIETDEQGSDDDIASRTIRNPSDSLGLLARTAFHRERALANSWYANQNQNQNQNQQHGHSAPIQTIDSQQSQITVNERLAKFCLVEQELVSPIGLKTLVNTFFSRHHQYMPIIPAHRIPMNDYELCTLAETEPLLVITFVIIASRFEDRNVHTATWKYMSEIIQDLVLGVRRPTLGAIESLLLLSESLANFSQVNEKEMHDFEERFSWHLIGQAVRMSYYLGLDQKTLLTNDETMNEEAHRMRLIWTYCYFEERQTSIRFGKAFWTRGPTLCFPVPYVNSKSGSESFYNFPTLIPSAYSREDYASYMQALIDITDILSNIHDLLYPSRDRTISLVHMGDYHKILDELTMGFATYKIAWAKKEWKTLSLNETVWVSFYYAKLYAYGFAFQAHMKRMSETSGNRVNAQSMFPKSLSASPDMKFIIEAKNAAMKVLEICVDNLHSYGAMAYLPSRYYGYFGYAAVFLVKIVFTEAVHYEEQKEMVNLIKRTISCICDDSKGIDRHHPLLRCAQQLRTLLQTLWTARGVNFGDLSMGGDERSASMVPMDHQDGTQDAIQLNPLADDIKAMVDNFTLDQYSPQFMEDSTQAAIQDLTASLANDLNGDFWLPYFSEMYGELYGA